MLGYSIIIVPSKPRMVKSSLNFLYMGWVADPLLALKFVGGERPSQMSFLVGGIVNHYFLLLKVVGQRVSYY